MSVIDTGRVFEIYSVGDGEFMRRVIDSVAAMSNTGLLLQLVGFGLMLGLLIMGFKNVMHGGSKLDLGTTLVSIMLGGIMFGLKADVVIHDMNFAPGEIDQPSYRVDNVPFGIAAAGYLISGSGYALTEKMETGYGLYTGGRSTLIEGGFGNTLEWINAVRMWEVPTFDSTDGSVGRFRENVGTYINECTLPAIEMGHLRYGALTKSTQLFTYGTAAGAGGFGYSSEYLMFEYVDSGGTRQSLTCKAGFSNITNDSLVVMPQFANAIARNKLDLSSSGSDAQGAMQDAYTTVGFTTDEMQKLILAQAVGLSLHNAVSGKASTSALSTQTKMMIEQASLQRAVQWASEETMFRRIMRPMMAFFESLMYALAPFMALAIGLGSFGIQTVMRYLMLSIWVILWLPMLSIIQLYQITMMQHGVAGIRGAIDTTGGVGASIAGAEQMRTLAIDWLGSGAAMAAFTPALTMALVWGGAVTASALAGKMQGGDHVNEKMTAPDVAGTPPAVGTASGWSSSPGGGFTRTGAESSLPSVSWGSVATASATSSAGVAEQNSHRAAAGIQNAISESFDKKRQAEAAAGFSNAGFASGSYGGSWQHATEAGGDDTVSSQRQTAAGSSLTSSNSIGADLGLGANTPKGPVGAKAGVNAGATNADGESSSSSATTTTGSGGSKREGDGFNLRGTNESGQKIEDFVRAQASQGVGWAQSLMKSSGTSSEWAKIESASKEFKEAAGLQSEFGSKSSERLDAASARAVARGADGGLIGDVTGRQGGAGLLKVAEQDLSAQHGGAFAGGSRQLKAAAAIAVLAGNYDNLGAKDGWDTSAQGKGERANDLMERMHGNGPAGASAYGGGGVPNADSNRGLAPGASDAALVDSKIGSAPQAPNVNGAAIEQAARAQEPNAQVGAVAQHANIGQYDGGGNLVPPTAGQDGGDIAQHKGEQAVARTQARELKEAADNSDAALALQAQTQTMQRALDEGNPTTGRNAIMSEGNTPGNFANLFLNSAVIGGASPESIAGIQQSLMAENEGMSKEQAYVMAVASAERITGNYPDLATNQDAQLVYQNLSPEEQKAAREGTSDFTGDHARSSAAMRSQADQILRDAGLDPDEEN